MRRAGWTLIELAVAMAVASIMAAGIVSIFIPQVSSYFHAVSNTTLQSAAADAVKIILEGDPKARGLRFADPTQPILAAAGDSLTYRYFDLAQTSADTPHEVTIAYDPAQHVITRTVDGGAAEYVPYYARAGGSIALDALETDLFRYYDDAGNELTGSIDENAVEHITAGVEAAYAGGLPNLGGAKTRLKSGVFIKRSG